MASLNAKWRTNFEQWLADIDHNDLRIFVFANTTAAVGFGSDDFILIHRGISDGEPVDCHMIEARINGNTKDKQLKKLVKTTGSKAKDQTRLAFALVSKAVNGHCRGEVVRQALRQSPILGKTVVNKVHVRWSPHVRWEGGWPMHKVGVSPFVFEKIPFEGHEVDGTVASKKDKGKK